jgi:outer membrane immunogenic protein
MRTGLVAAGAAVMLFLPSITAPATAQSADALARLEAKLDALEKENSALRDRVRRIETRNHQVAAVEPPKRTAAAPLPAVADTAASAQAAAPGRGRAMSDCGAYRFNGAYAGVHGGAVNYSANRLDRDGYLTAPAPNTPSVSSDAWGGEVGGQFGYNWTTCSTLLGIELDGSWSQASRTAHLVNFPGITATVKSELDGFASARVRSGIVLDNTLLYATGGLALAHTRTTWTTNFIGLGPTESLTDSNWSFGGVAGVGAEWALSDRLSLRAEALYFMFADRDYTLNSPILGPVHFTNNDSMWVTRAALNYRFMN